MNVIWPEPGKYIVAISGGVDSVCLLDMLIAHGGYELVVAHVDHGIREDSAKDRELAQELAQNNKLYIVITKLNFSKETSENELRQARYNFLFEQMQQLGARAILTAHHADDVLETSIMNVRRGTDRYGAAGGMTREGIVRPFMKVTKKELLEYAQKHNLEWHEDSTNTDLAYTRNQVRHQVIPAIDAAAYQKHLTALADLNQKIDTELKGLISIEHKTVTLLRKDLNQLSLRELEVLLAYAIRQIDPSFELSQPRIAQTARQIMLGAHKISFSISASDGIIIDIP